MNSDSLDRTSKGCGAAALLLGLAAVLVVLLLLVGVLLISRLDFAGDASLDEAYSSLQTWETEALVPTTMRTGQSTEVRFSVGSAGAVGDLIPDAEGTRSDVRSGTQLAVRLTVVGGKATTIAASSESQALLQDRPTVWVWDVTPDEEGTITVRLTGDILLLAGEPPISAELYTQNVRVLDGRTLWEKAKDGLTSVAGIVSSIIVLGGAVGWLVVHVRRSRRNSDSNAPRLL